MTQFLIHLKTMKIMRSKSGKVIKINNTKAEVIPLNKYDIEEKTCRDFKKVVTKDGKRIEEDSTACRDENGNWRVI